ncbi:hypothetical protein QAD02_001624 [Eretmocerus hayati]|uniref:Uncharacterized protein n=1 Tax=Eretmocerus hayati TaxID=131215 RepID=A0ACC2NLD9_9HYME|nr:hypothetical protein QAD02_001624 [Eretmocerus hayati]
MLPIEAEDPDHTPPQLESRRILLENTSSRFTRVAQLKTLGYPELQDHPESKFLSRESDLQVYKMDLGLINRAATVVTKKLKNLEEGMYQVTSLIEVPTRFGNRIVAELNSDFQMFLPQLLSMVIASDQRTFNLMMGAAIRGELRLKLVNSLTMELIHDDEKQYHA